jgi:putative hydrolase of the HAD superfamily
MGHAACGMREAAQPLMPHASYRMPIRAVAFDLWETLITDTPELSRRQERLRIDRMEEILRARGFGAAAEQIERAYRSMWHRCQELYWSSDVDIPCRRQIEHFLEEMGLDAKTFDEETLSRLEHVYANAALEILPVAIAGASGTLRELKRRGFKIGLISNTGRTPGYVLREILDRLGLASSIDAMVFSNEHGECKPRTSIFDSLRRSLALAPDEIVFIGDNLYVDVFGAQRYGMRAIHFLPAVRGTAVAPPVEHGEEIVPDAVIATLDEVPSVIETLEAVIDCR